MTRIIHHQPGKPVLIPLPITPHTLIARTSGARRSGAPSKHTITVQVAQARALLATSPCTMGDIHAALQCSYDQARWVIKKLRLAGEIEQLDGKHWQPVQPKPAV